MILEIVFITKMEGKQECCCQSKININIKITGFELQNKILNILLNENVLKTLEEEKEKRPSRNVWFEDDIIFKEDENNFEEANIEVPKKPMKEDEDWNEAWTEKIVEGENQNMFDASEALIVQAIESILQD